MNTSIVGEFETRIYIGSVLFILYNVNLFILFFLPLINAFTKPSIYGEVESRIYICSLLFILYNVHLFILLFFFTPDKRIYKVVCFKGG